MQLPRIAALLVPMLVVSSSGAQTLETQWADLASAEEAKAMRALLALAARPNDSVRFLKSRLVPVKADSKRVEQLLGQLKNSNFGVRNQTMAELEYLGKYIRTDLEKALKSGLDAETSARVKQLLDRMPEEKKQAEPANPLKGRPGSSVSVSNINGQIQIVIDGQPLDLSKMAPPPAPPGPLPQWVRVARAVTLLEHLGTPEAHQLLESLARGEPGALPTQAAREALTRLKNAKQP